MKSRDVDPLQIQDIPDPNEDLEPSLNPLEFKGLEVGSRDWTIHTLITQVMNGTIDLNPKFQRRSAWNDTKRSRFLESLMLGVPIPQLVLARTKRDINRFVVIDGKQRLLTITGLMDDSYDFWAGGRIRDLLTLTNLNGVLLKDFKTSNVYAANRHQLMNQSIRAALIIGVKSQDVLYDIFYRLNSGSVPLSGQELRQALLRGGFSNYLFDITNKRNESIHQVMNIEGPDQRMYDAELVLRVLANAMGVVPYRGNLKAFLDDTTKALNDKWIKKQTQVDKQYAVLNTGIKNVAKVLEYSQIGRRSLAGGFDSRLNKALLEVELYYFGKLKANPASKKAAFQNALKKLCARPDFREAIESTTKSVVRYRRRFSLFGKLIKSVFGETLSLPKIGA